jgi:hypothetical protein
VIHMFKILAQIVRSLFVFGRIPPRFEEGYETHVNVWYLLERNVRRRRRAEETVGTSDRSHETLPEWSKLQK